MSPRLAALASFIGAVIGASAGVMQEAGKGAPVSSATSSPASSLLSSPVSSESPRDCRGVLQHAGADLPAEADVNAAVRAVTIRVVPPPSDTPRYAGLLASIDTEHKGYVTQEDIQAYSEGQTGTSRPDVVAQDAR